MVDYQKLLTIEELADFLKVSKITIRNWVKSGTMPKDCYIRAGSRTYRFDKEKVMEAFSPEPDPKEEEDDASSDAPEQLPFDLEETEKHEPFLLDWSDDDEGEL